MWVNTTYFFGSDPLKFQAGLDPFYVATAK